MKKITAGWLFQSNSIRVGQTILDVYNENRSTARAQNEKILQQSKKTYQKQREAANVIIAQITDPTNMSNKELKILLLPLKIKADGTMPTRKKEMIKLYMRWKDLAPSMFDVSVAPVEEGNGGAGDADESDEDSDELGYVVAEIWINLSTSV